MKTKNLLMALATCLCIAFASTAFAQLPDPGDIPIYPIENEQEIIKMLEKADEVVNLISRFELIRNDLLKKYGKKIITENGQQIITTEKPVPIKELELLKPMLPYLKFEPFNELVAKLKSLKINLNNFLKKEPTNMGHLLLQKLTPKKANDTLIRVNAIEDLFTSDHAKDLLNSFNYLN